MSIELKCSHDLAKKLGAIEPVNASHFKAMRESEQYILVRDPETLQAVFWPVVQGLITREWRKPP